MQGHFWAFCCRFEMPWEIQLWTVMASPSVASQLRLVRGLVGCKLRQDSPGSSENTPRWRGILWLAIVPWSAKEKTHQSWVIAIGKNSFVSPEWWNQGKLALNLQKVHMDAFSKPYAAIVLFSWKKFSHYYLFAILCSVQNGSHGSYVFVAYLKCSWSELKFFINVNYTSISENIV